MGRICSTFLYRLLLDTDHDIESLCALDRARFPYVRRLKLEE